MNCDICEREIVDQGETPTYIGITGYKLLENQEDIVQFSRTVCKDCLINRSNEILDELEENAEEYA